MKRMTFGIFDLGAGKILEISPVDNNRLNKRMVGGDGNLSGTQVKKHEVIATGSNWKFLSDGFGVGYLLIYTDSIPGDLDAELLTKSIVFDDLADQELLEIRAELQSIIGDRIPGWWHHVVDESVPLSDAFFVGSKPIQFDGSQLRHGYGFSQVSKFRVDDERILNALICAHREWFFIDRDNRALTSILLAGAHAENQQKNTLDYMRAQMVRNILLNEQVLFLSGLEIQIYDELREAWSIPDLVLKLESRIREIYEIVRIELSEVEAKKNERRNLWLTMITVLTGFQMIWSLWDFIFEPTNLLTASNYWRLGLVAVSVTSIATILLRFLLPLRRKSTGKSKQ
jgi:hypothetical protein